MGNRKTSFGRARKLTAWVMAFVMILSFFATPLAQIALAAPDESGSESLSDNMDVGANDNAAESGEESPEVPGEGDGESAESTGDGESASPAESAEGDAPAEGGDEDVAPVEGDGADEGVGEPESTEAGPEPTEEAEPAEAPAEMVTVTAHWYIASQNEETSEPEDTLVFTKALTGVRGEVEFVNAKALNPETEYNLIGYVVDDERSGTTLGVYELLFDEDGELNFYFTSEDLLQQAPENGLYVNIYRNVSGATPVYTAFLTSEELVSLTSIDAATYYLAAGISAAWTLNTAQSGAAQSQSVSVASIVGDTVNFYFDAPGGSWTGMESVANPVDPQVTGQSVVVYTYAALKAAMQNAAYSYIEFGANLSYTNTATSTAANTEATITITPNRAGPVLTLNAKGYEFRTNRTGNNVIRYAGTATGTTLSNLTRIVYQDWNVPEHRSNYGIFHKSSTSYAIALVFDGLTFAGPRLTDAHLTVSLVLDGTRNPVDITITRPGNTGDAAVQLTDASSSLSLQGQVSIIRENTTTTDAIVVTNAVTVGAGADVFVEDKRSSGLFVGTPPFTLQNGASFTYRGNRQFSSGNLASLTVGENATFDLRASGAITSYGLLRVGGPLTIENNAAFVVVGENNTAATPVVYTSGANSNISITNPRALLVYQSNANATAARAWTFATTGRTFSYTGAGLARWDAVLGAVPPANGNYGAPTQYWTNSDAAPLTITAATYTTGTFSSPTFSNYVRVGDATPATSFSFNGKVIADADFAGVGRYTVEYWLRTPNEVGPPTETLMDLPPYQNFSWSGQTAVYIPFPPAAGYRRVEDQPVTAPHVPGGTRTIKAYYEPINIELSPIELGKTAVRLDDDEWEVTLTIDSDSESYTPAVDLDVMLTLDRSGSMSATRRNAVKNAAIAMVNALSTNGK
ncbi:MAG: hypothetical protein LBH86_04160, partial [Oscillospiraceae bacterium]|nr:hypothetical protein [Oscillospiraceae bacterium]